MIERIEKFLVTLKPSIWTFTEFWPLLDEAGRVENRRKDACHRQLDLDPSRMNNLKSVEYCQGLVKTTREALGSSSAGLTESNSINS